MTPTHYFVHQFLWVVGWIGFGAFSVAAIVWGIWWVHWHDIGQHRKTPKYKWCTIVLLLLAVAFCWTIARACARFQEGSAPACKGCCDE